MNGNFALQLNPPIRVETVHGPGWAILYESYGIDFNGVMLVANLEDGKMRWYDCCDPEQMVWAGGNFTFGVKPSKIKSETSDEKSKEGNKKNG